LRLQIDSGKGVNNIVAIQVPLILAQALTSNAGPPQHAPAASADEAQAARFRKLLQFDGTSGTASAPESAAVTASEAGTRAGRPASLGDAILQSLDKARNTLNQGWASTAALIDPQAGPVSTQRLLQFQVGVFHVGFQQQLVGSIASRTAQSIDQLVKMQ
jgi:hypothetical protein